MSTHQPVRRNRHADALGILDDSGHVEGSLADVVERLFRSFEAQLSLTTIVRVVRRCRREMEIISGPPLAGGLERLAHKRLTALVAAQTTPPALDPSSTGVWGRPARRRTGLPHGNSHSRS